MIVVDANILIAFLDRDEAHHAAVVDSLAMTADEALASTALTIAEALVHPSLAGTASDAERALDSIGLQRLVLGGSDARSLAELRARSRLRMPDAVVLHAAQQHHATLCTTDTALARAAESLGVPTLRPGA
ncbi:type II toxin-antitoxin system VapC family toxin [Arenivirga flava]|uniref:type II toxin-antitoxin system VapC family toxin n=1 Tax=Arenivirga flava TaxID=1930060 RepID=UPI0024E0727A|nr:type II toxin-antitoxin system VapC family toxin [Arenivirga flava]